CIQRALGPTVSTTISSQLASKLWNIASPDIKKKFKKLAQELKAPIHKEYIFKECSFTEIFPYEKGNNSSSLSNTVENRSKSKKNKEKTKPVKSNVADRN